MTSEVNYLNIGSVKGLVAHPGDVFFYSVKTGAGFTTTAGQTGKEFPQIAYDVSKVNSVSIQYAAANSGNRGSVKCEIDGVSDTVASDNHSTTAQTKTYDLTGKSSLILIGCEDNGTANWGDTVSGKCTFT